MRESEARIASGESRAEAIVVYDVDAERYVDVNENAERFFWPGPRATAAGGAGDLSPRCNPMAAFGERVRECVNARWKANPRCMNGCTGIPSARIWSAKCGWWRMPSGSHRLVRAALPTSPTQAHGTGGAAERQVFEQLTSNASLEEVLASSPGLIESVGIGTVCSSACWRMTDRPFSPW